MFKCMEEGENFKTCFMKEMSDYDWAAEYVESLSKRSSREFENQVKKSENHELLSFFRNAILKNYRLKSSLKTTRF